MEIGLPKTKWQWLKLIFDVVFWVSWIWMLFWLRNKEIVCQDYCKNICPQYEPFYILNYSKNMTIGELLEILNKTG